MPNCMPTRLPEQSRRFVPELRHDPLTGESVFLAPERMSRPNALGWPQTTPPIDETRANCPFCPGREEETPAAEFCVPRDGPWQIRVFPNLYPAVNPRDGSSPTSPSIAGYHEVLVECREHVATLTALESAAFERLGEAYFARMQVLAEKPGVRSLLIFKNQGPAAGASLAHPHSQLMALDHVPRRLAEEIQGSHRIWQTSGECWHCRSILEAHDTGRCVYESEHFAVVAPWASRVPYELCLLPKRHTPTFLHSTSHERTDWAQILRHTLRNLEKLSNAVSYNYLIHSAPFDTIPYDHYHWHVEILPRLTRLAGFEWGSGSYINPVAPEQAAESLRSVDRSRFGK